jgi:hypothetical protein
MGSSVYKPTVGDDGIGRWLGVKVVCLYDVDTLVADYDTEESESKDRIYDE